MSKPTLGSAHESDLLTNISIAYMQEASQYIATQVFPIVKVQKQASVYRVYDQNDWFRDEFKRRADGSPSFEVGFGLSTSSYSCENWAAGQMLGGQLIANYDEPGDAEGDAIKHLMQLALIRRERSFAADFFTTGVWTGDTTPSNLWDTSSGDPLLDVNTAKNTILTNTGREANTIVVSYNVLNALKNNGKVREQFKYTSADSIDEMMLARYFGVKKFLVSKAAYATNIEGATAAQAMALGKHCLVCHTADVPSLMQPSAGYTFSWAGLTGMNDDGIISRRFELPERNAIKVELELAFDMKQVSSSLGYFLSAVVS